MARRRLNQELERLAHRLQRASEIVPTAQTHLAERLAHCDTNNKEPGSRTSGGHLSDPTISQVLARSNIITVDRRIKALIVDIRLAIDELDTACNTALGRQGTAETEIIPTCNGGDPTKGGSATGCDRYVDHYTRADGSIAYRNDGMCAMHRQARWRWEQQNRVTS